MFTQQKKLNKALRWIGWVLLLQLVLLSLSSALYAYRFTHFYEGTPPTHTTSNIFVRTWQLFTGPKLYKDTAEAAPLFAYEEVHWKNRNKQEISAWYSGVDSNTTCIILLHGYSANKRMMLSEAAEFKQWGYAVLLPDFSGHGKSEGRATSFGAEESNEVEAAAAFARSRGKQKIILYGISMGAVVALEAAAENKIHPLAVVADMPFQSLHHHVQSRAKFLGFPAEPFGTMVTFWIGVERGFNGFGFNVGEDVKNINCPVLLQCGEKDSYVKRSETNAIYQNLHGTKKLVSYPDADHVSLLGNDPNKWETEVKSFLESL